MNLLNSNFFPFRFLEVVQVQSRLSNHRYGVIYWMPGCMLHLLMDIRKVRQWITCRNTQKHWNVSQNSTAHTHTHGYTYLQICSNNSCFFAGIDANLLIRPLTRGDPRYGVVVIVSIGANRTVAWERYLQSMRPLTVFVEHEELIAATDIHTHKHNNSTRRNKMKLIHKLWQNGAQMQKMQKT